MGTHSPINFGRVLSVVAILICMSDLTAAVKTKNSTILALQKEAAQGLAALEHGDDDDYEEDEPLEDAIITPPEPIAIAGPAPQLAPSSTANLNDEDAKCYTARY